MSDIPTGSSPGLHTLARLAEAARPEVDASRVVAVFAHPDDETIAAGAQLHRLKGLRLVVVTDGAPRDLRDAQAHGFEDATSYAAARREELAAALAAGGAGDLQVEFINIPDQGVAHALANVSRRLVAALGDAEVVLTHVYEGGHPDHDGVAFAVHAAVAALATQGRAIEVIEAPLYRLGRDDAFDPQDFDPIPGAVAVQLVLDPEEAARKERMIAAHATQRDTLAQFPVKAERFRKAPHYDFTEPANHGRLWYERFDWGLTGDQWRAKAREALKELGLDKPPTPDATSSPG